MTGEQQSRIIRNELGEVLTGYGCSNCANWKAKPAEYWQVVRDFGLHNAEEHIGRAALVRVFQKEKVVRTRIVSKSIPRKPQGKGRRK